MEQKPPESALQLNSDSGHNYVSKNDSNHPCGREKLGACELSQERLVDGDITSPTISIRISQPVDITNPTVGVAKSAILEEDVETGAVSASKKFSLPKSESYREECRQIIGLGGLIQLMKWDVDMKGLASVRFWLHLSFYLEDSCWMC